MSHQNSAKKRRATPGGKFNALFRRGTPKTGNAPEASARSAARRTYHSRNSSNETLTTSSRGEEACPALPVQNHSCSVRPSQYICKCVQATMADEDRCVVQPGLA